MRHDIKKSSRLANSMKISFNYQKGITLRRETKEYLYLVAKGRELAAYSEKQLTVLDDTLSGFDANTSGRCFHALVGDAGILRTGGRAVIMVTHNAQWLPYADQIIVLGQDGKICAKGDLEAVKNSSSYVQEMYKENVVDVTQTPSSKLGQRSSTTATIGMLFWYSFRRAAVQLSKIALWLKHWVAMNKEHPNQNVGTWTGIYMLFAFGQVMFIALGTGYFLLFLVARSAKNIHRKLLHTAFGFVFTIYAPAINTDRDSRAPMSFFITEDTGVIVNLFTSDLNLIDLALPISFVITSERLLATVADIILTCIASGYLAISVPFLAAILFILQRVYLKTSRQLRALDLALKAPLFSHFIATAAGLTTVRAFSWTSTVEKQNTKLLDMSQRSHYLLFCLQRWLTLVLDLIIAASATLLVGLAVALRDKIDPSYLGVALVSVMGLGQTLSSLIIFWTNLETSLQAVSRIKDYTISTPVEYEKLHDDNPRRGDAVGDDWPPRGQIVMSDVSAEYGAQKVLNGINLTFAAGSKVAICGRTGSGKSSLLGLFLRMYEPASGSITVDDHNISSISPPTVRKSIVALPQDPVFLTGSVRYNLDPYALHTNNHGKLWDVLTKVGLRGTVEEMGGLDAQLVVDGFSAGQRQLFCLAGVMLRDGRVLLLDEATSSLDIKIEQLVNQLIQEEFTQWTVIAVTHRLKSVVDQASGFDRVVVLDRGRVVESGAPEELLKKGRGGVFWRMVEMEKN
ncbi:ABC transporter [Lachnellula hyalina]|uniref:ABC transporter n=1 Tax=Lachnellula hyalina TaxID=1316788 RepID=A0A8H8R7W9_9HELO|nr:ABC transporter [Lachnellula hyalina]TVY29331.1 ABC transporter [Lachnellula hyalina]